MSNFSDADPEDAWAASDSSEEQLRVIKLMLLYTITHMDDFSVAEHRRRIEYIIDSVDFVAGRVRTALQDLIGDN